MTNEQAASLAQTIYAAPMVARVTKWEAGKTVRHYVQLTEQAPAGCKIWIDPAASAIMCDFGRKACTPAFSAALDAFETFVATLGAVSRAYPGAPDFRVAV